MCVCCCCCWWCVWCECVAWTCVCMKREREREREGGGCTPLPTDRQRKALFVYTSLNTSHVYAFTEVHIQIQESHRYLPVSHSDYIYSSGCETRPGSISESLVSDFTVGVKKQPVLFRVVFIFHLSSRLCPSTAECSPPPMPSIALCVHISWYFMTLSCGCEQNSAVVMRYSGKFCVSIGFAR